MDAMQISTLIVAVVGAVLGILNTWRAFGQDRLRVVVRPSHAFLPNGAQHMAIEVVNLSNFAVTITGLGFTLVGGKEHFPLQDFRLTSGGSFPVRLEPRANFTALVPSGAYPDSLIARFLKVYANTACGRRVEGTSGALQQLVLTARAATK